MSSLGDFRDVKHRTIFHDLLDSSILPPEDKTVGRLWQEAQLLLSAGTVTTATSIGSALVYLLLDQDRLKVLLEELETAMPSITSPKRQAELEQLPYLVCCLISSNIVGLQSTQLTISRVPWSKRLSDLCQECLTVSFVQLPPKLYS
jgi:cytochrome P450